MTRKYILPTEECLHDLSDYTKRLAEFMVTEEMLLHAAVDYYFQDRPTTTFHLMDYICDVVEMELESKSPFLDECEIPDTQSLLDDAIGTAQEATVVLAEKLHETFHAIGEHTPDAPEWNIERLSDKKYIAVAGQSHGTQTVNDTIARANSERDRPSNAAWPF